ncbi:MAG TPA: hypothetical protein VM142_10985 [Acidimicrobiales bacterium]|nr:hypothetical protein [Acidimicrobiales bacterium]
MACGCVVAVLVGFGVSPAGAGLPAGRPVLAAAAAPSACDVPLVGAVCSVPGAIGGAIDAVTGIPAAIAGDVTEGFARWIASGAAGFLEQAGRAIFSGTEVNLAGTGEGGRPWFLGHYDKMALVGLSVFAPMLILAVLHAVFSQSLALLGRAVANLPIAAIGTAAAVSLVGLFLGATDQACLFLAGGLGADSKNFLSGIVATLVNPVTVVSGVGGAAGLFGVALLALFMAFTAFVVWLELLVREAAIYLTVLFLPIGFATYIWPALSSWLRRLVEVIVALVLSKLVIVAALSLAGSALAAQQGLGALVAGAGMLLLAAYAPFALFKLIPIASMAAISSLEGQGRRGAKAAVPRTSSVFYARQLASSGSRSSSSAGGGGGSGFGPRPGENSPPAPGGRGGRPSGGAGVARTSVGGGAGGSAVGSGAGRGGIAGGSGSAAGAVSGPVGAGAAVASTAARTAKNAAVTRATNAAENVTPPGDGGNAK